MSYFDEKYRQRRADILRLEPRRDRAWHRVEAGDPSGEQQFQTFSNWIRSYEQQAADLLSKKRFLESMN